MAASPSPGAATGGRTRCGAGVRPARARYSRPQAARTACASSNGQCSGAEQQRCRQAGQRAARGVTAPPPAVPGARCAFRRAAETSSQDPHSCDAWSASQLSRNAEAGAPGLANAGARAHQLRLDQAFARRLVPRATHKPAGASRPPAYVQARGGANASRSQVLVAVAAISVGTRWRRQRPAFS
jgi:hypothetical protein